MPWYNEPFVTGKLLEFVVPEMNISSAALTWTLRPESLWLAPRYVE